MQHYQHMIECAAAKVVSGVPREYRRGLTKEELVGAGIVGAYRAFDTYFAKKRTSPAKAFVLSWAMGEMKAAVHANERVSRNEYRRAKSNGVEVVRVTSGSDQRDPDAPELIDVAPDTHDLCATDVAKLDQLSGVLDQRQLQVISLHWFSGMDMGQIALRLRIDKRDAQAVQDAAFAKLKTEFGYEALAGMFASA